MRVLIVLLLAALAATEIISIKKCKNDAADKCTINEARVEPCPSKKHGCLLKKGRNASISFDFTPNFTADKLEAIVMYQTSRFDAIDADACQSTQCPTEANKQQTYNYNLYLGTKLPRGQYSFDWSLVDKNDSSNKCCFQMSIELKK